MPRGSRKKKGNLRRIIVIALIPIVPLGLALTWVWKSNQIKDHYRRLKKLEIERANLISENMRVRTELTDLKSLTHINAVVTREFGLTQNVSERIFLADPVKRENKPSKHEFAGDLNVPNWLETAVVGSGGIRAEEPENPGEKAK